MEFNINKTGGLKVSFIKEGESLDNPIYKWAKDHKNFKGEMGELLYFPKLDGESEVLFGLGNLDEIDLDKIRLGFYKLAKLLQDKNEKEVEISMPDLKMCNRKTLMAVYEGFRQAEYLFSKKEIKKESKELIVNYTAFKGPEEKLKEGLNRIKSQMEGVFLARDLVNETSNVIYPESLANIAKEKLENLGVDVKVYNKEEIKDMGLVAFLSVAQGSDKEAKLIVMKYIGDKESSLTTGLVGKGLTYDSGGYSIKSAKGMASMHCDMGGAGTVIGTMYALAKSKAKSNVVGVVAACENLISGKAYKTGDIISSLSGKTIEVANTDAEGRLTLADAVYYTSNNLKVDKIIDLATLTGAVSSALGEEYTGAITNNEEFFEDFKLAASEAGEKVWELPNDEKYKEYYKSKVADLKNISSYGAGTITAGQFVGEFVTNNIPWIHLDIAGTAYISKATGYLPERATGIHVKALHNLLNPISEC
ncbi:MAG: leucyl aminopeptidase [Peptoniphilaceae bacterium]